jgi:mRNA interferase MazF
MKRGDLWWARLDERAPIVLLSEATAGEWRAMRIVAPATDAEKRGFVILSGEEALDLRGTEPSGIEVAIGVGEFQGVVRVGLPQDGRVFCTWELTAGPGDLIERVGALSPAKLAQLDNALRLAAIE